MVRDEVLLWAKGSGKVWVVVWQWVEIQGWGVVGQWVEGAEWEWTEGLDKALALEWVAEAVQVGIRDLGAALATAGEWAAAWAVAVSAVWVVLVGALVRLRINRNL